MRAITCKIQGFLKDQRVVDREAKSIQSLSQATVGCLLDELKFEVTLQSERDIDSFISLLIQSKPCFTFKKPNIDKLPEDCQSFSDGVCILPINTCKQCYQ